MRREIFGILILCTLVSAGLDQSYVHDVSRDGTSTITRTIDVSAFTAQLEDDAIERIDETCKGNPNLACSVDLEREAITMRQEFPARDYSFEANHGLFFIDYQVTIRIIPTDDFGSSLEELMLKSGVLEEGSEEDLEPIDLNNKQQNLAIAAFLEMFESEFSYQVNMPSAIQEANAGEINGRTLNIDMIDVMKDSETIVIKSSEANWVNIFVLASVIAIGALTLSFFLSKKQKK